MKQAESKFFDMTDSVTSLVTTGENTLSECVDVQIPQGDGDNQRIGNRVFLKGIKLKTLVDTSASMSLRFMLLRFPIFSTAIQTAVNTDFDGATVGIIGQLPRNVDYKYQVLLDRVLNIDPDHKGVLAHSRYYKINKHVEYVAAATSSPNRNHILLLVYTNNTTADNINIDCNGRAFYKDI